MAPTLAPAVAGELSVGGMTYADAADNAAVFAATVAALAGVDAGDVEVTVIEVDGVIVVEYSVTAASVAGADALAATLEAELTEEAVADELAVQAEALDVADAFEDVEVEDVSPPLVVRQTEAPTPSDVCADCCARKKRRRSLRFGYYDACDGCDC